MVSYLLSLACLGMSCYFVWFMSGGYMCYLYLCQSINQISWRWQVQAQLVLFRWYLFRLGFLFTSDVQGLFLKRGAIIFVLFLRELGIVFYVWWFWSVLDVLGLLRAERAHFFVKINLEYLVRETVNFEEPWLAVIRDARSVMGSG